MDFITPYTEGYLAGVQRARCFNHDAIALGRQVRKFLSPYFILHWQQDTGGDFYRGEVDGFLDAINA